MSDAQWEFNEVESYYNLGVISLEYRNKLLNDITIILWSEM